MLDGAYNSTQTRDGTAESFQLTHKQKQEMDKQENEFSSSEFTHQSLSAQIVLVTDPILRQVEKMCACFSEQHDLVSVGNGETTRTRLNDTPASSSRNRKDPA